MSLAQLIRDMAAAGAPPEAIALAVEAIEATEAKLAEKRRVERDRKRRQRERERDGDGTVTGQSRDNTGTVTDEPSPVPPSPKPPQTPQEPLPPCPHPDGKSRARKAGRFPPPDGVSAEQWAAFCQQRKKPFTEHAYGLHCAKLGELARKGHQPGDLIDLAIERGWETVFEPKPGDRPAASKAGQSAVVDPAKRAQALEERAQMYDRMGRDVEARDLRRDAERLRGQHERKGAALPIGSLISRPEKDAA